MGEEPYSMFDETVAAETKRPEAETKRQAPRITWVAHEVPAYVCRSCGAVLPKPREGERCLEIYCDDCANAILARRERHAKRQARCRVRRVHIGERSWIEYRGTFPAGLFEGREVEEMQTSQTSQTSQTFQTFQTFQTSQL